MVDRSARTGRAGPSRLETPPAGSRAATERLRIRRKLGVEASGERVEGRQILEQIAERDLDAEGPLDRGARLRQEQRVEAELEEGCLRHDFHGRQPR